MTVQERRHPDVLKASRKKRIAAGSGTRVEDINRLLKMHRTMADLMKTVGGKKRGPMAGLANMMGLSGGMPSADEIAKLGVKLPGGLPGAGAPRLPPTVPGISGGLPGLGGRLPGLGGRPPGFDKKK